MREYIMSVIGAGLLCSVSEIISPDKWKKYIKLLTGVIITIIMLSPVKQIDFDVVDDFRSITPEYPTDNSLLLNTVKSEFENRISEDIKERIFQKYDVNSEVVTTSETDDNGNVTGIALIQIKTFAECPGVTDMITQIYGVNKDLVIINDR